MRGLLTKDPKRSISGRLNSRRVMGCVKLPETRKFLARCNDSNLQDTFGLSTRRKLFGPIVSNVKGSLSATFLIAKNRRVAL